MSIDGVIARHWAWLPVSESTPYLSLGEGNTPWSRPPTSAAN